MLSFPKPPHKAASDGAFISPPNPSASVLEIQKGHRFLELDSLRSLAALAVVLGHFNNALGKTTTPFFTFATHLFGSGHAAVMLFFVLSGFVLTGLSLGRDRPTYIAFLIKRICRLYLPYAAAILFAAALAAKLYSAVPTGNFWIDQTWSTPFSARLLLQHLLMIGHYDNTRLNTAIWSLLVEMRVSLFFPALAWIADRLRPIHALALFPAATCLFASLSQRTGHSLVCDTLFYSLLFLFGALLRTHYDETSRSQAALSPSQRWTLLLVAITLYQGAELLPTILGNPALSAYLIDWLQATGAAILLVLATTLTPLRHALHNRVLLWAGTRSYSIYLLHATVLFTLIRLHPQGPIPLAYLPVYLTLTLVLSELFYRFIEAPSILLGRRFSRLQSIRYKSAS